MQNPWGRLPDAAPFVLPEDSLAIEVYNERNRGRKDRQVHTELLPEPFIGRVDAPVVVLALNPGFSKQDVKVQERPVFRERLRRAITEGATEHPFYHLDPSLPGPGQVWWKRTLGPLVDEYGASRVAQRTLCLEYFPYHSITFAHGALRLPSQAYTFELLRAALKRAGPVILMRGESQWYGAVPELARYPGLFRTRTQRVARVSAKNCPDGYLAAREAITA